jgi:DNA-directed RNA polymerase sigma subunit (sigma70/sigma32)
MLTERQLIFSVLFRGKWLSIGEQKHGLLNIFKTRRLHEETPRGATNSFLGTGQERRVTEMRYQLRQTRASSMEDIPLPYTEVSRQLGMTAELVKATEIRALLKMRFWATRVPYRPTR